MVVLRPLKIEILNIQFFQIINKVFNQKYKTLNLTMVKKINNVASYTLIKFIDANHNTGIWR